jgi:hypothetical protein
MSSAVGLDNVHLMDGETIDRLHGGNTGNLAFVNAIDLHLGRKATVVSWGTPAAQLKAIADMIVIACANQLGPHVDLGRNAAVLEAAGLPVVAIGLGAQANSQSQDAQIPEGTQRWLRVLSDHAPSKAPNIGVRGAYTLAQLERLGLDRQAVVIGCPSNFTNLESDFVADIIARSERPVRRVASAAGQPHWPQLAAIERSILDLVDETDGSCIIQHNKLMVHLGQAEFNKIDEKNYAFLKAYFRPKLSDEEFAYWCRRNMLCFGNAEAWMKWLQRHDFVVGPRFHGIMLAIQAGVPAGCVAHDSRTLELCQTMALPVLDYKDVPLPLSLDSLRRLFPFDAERYRRTRRSLAQSYLSILDGAGLERDERLSDIAEIQQLAMAV